MLAQLSKELYTSGDNKARLGLLRTCVSLMPRLMPAFRDSELVDILARLTIHIDDELKLLAAHTLRHLVADYAAWRLPVFVGLTTFIL